MDMDPRIWRRLPEDILDRVLSFLPLKSLFDLRSTCKHFNSLIFSPHFISNHSLSSFILLPHPQCLHKSPLFNTDLNSWCTLPFSFPPSSTLLSSSSNGLLCFSIPDSSCFLVCNLLTGSARNVVFPTTAFTFDLFTLAAHLDGYRLFMLSSTGSSTVAFVYDSNPGSWRQFTGSPVPVLCDSHHQKGVGPHGGCLYFTTLEPFHAVRFRLDTGLWERPSVGALPARLTFARLVSDGGKKMYLVGGVGVSGISRSMRVWELEEDEGGEWREIETLPEMVYRKFVSVCYHNYEHVYCFWHRGMICVCCYTWPEILYYKVSRRSWHWLPRSPSLPDKWSCGFRWFSFNPNLHATA